LKRSERIVLVLSGALAAGTVGCDQGEQAMRLSAENTYTNNHYVPGAGYYHAPYHAWFPFPYNSYSPGRGYYYGGNWNAYPDEGKEVASRPTVRGVSTAQTSHNETVKRSGFGSSSRRTWS
jgi:hypothetical protein